METIKSPRCYFNKADKNKAAIAWTTSSPPSFVSNEHKLVFISEQVSVGIKPNQTPTELTEIILCQQGFWGLEQMISRGHLQPQPLPDSVQQTGTESWDGLGWKGP